MQLFLIVVVSLVFLHHPVEQKEKKAGRNNLPPERAKVTKASSMSSLRVCNVCSIIHMFPLKNVQRQETTSKLCS